MVKVDGGFGTEIRRGKTKAAIATNGKRLLPNVPVHVAGPLEIRESGKRVLPVNQGPALWCHCPAYFYQRQLERGGHQPVVSVIHVQDWLGHVPGNF